MHLKIILPAATVLMDAAAVVLGALLAYAVRFSEMVTAALPPGAQLPPVDWYLRLSLVLAGMTAVSLVAGGLYRFPSEVGLFEELSAALKRYFLAYTLLLAGLFFYRGVSFSRVTMALLLLFSGAGLLFSRSSGRWLRQMLYRSGRAVRRAALVGGGMGSEQLIRHIIAHPEFGLAIVGGIGDRQVEGSRLELLGKPSQVRDIIRSQRLDTLIVAPAAGEPDPVPQLVQACYGVNVDFLYVPDLAATNGRPRRVVKVGGMPLWALKDAPFTGWPGVVKRSFDLAAAGLMFLLLLPLMGLIAAAVKLDSRGPLLYRQRRVGMDGREFDCLKFRSMRVNAEAGTGPVWAHRDDPRTTRMGRFLRRWSLDELPQLWNVIQGDMSLVGPRPERPEFVRQFERRITGYQERHRVRAGMTGWAQVNGLRGNTPIDDRTVYDRYYVENWSLLFDLKILLLTLKAIIKGENSY